MNGRLVFLHGPLAALVFATAGIAGSACSSSDQNTDLLPEGAPTVIQVYVESAVSTFSFPLAEDIHVAGNGQTVDDPSGAGHHYGGIDGNDLTFGFSINVGQCDFDGTCPENTTCQTIGVLKLEGDLCVKSDMTQDGVQDAVVTVTGEPDSAGPIIQVAFKELLDPASVEGFLCACGDVDPDGDGPMTSDCPSGNIATTDTDCASCEDAPSTTAENEEGRCVDIDGDGVNDVPMLLAGVYSLTCGPVTHTATLGDGNDIGTSYYDPSGNQFVPIDSGFEGVGPRLYFFPPFPLPTSTQCTLTLSADIKDKDGNALADPRTFTFGTRPFEIVGILPEFEQNPEQGETPDPVPIEEAEVRVTFSAGVAAGSEAALTITPAIAGTTTVDGSDIVFVPDGDTWPVSTDVQVSVTLAGVTEDPFGATATGPFPPTFTYHFTTAAAPAGKPEVSRLKK